VFQKSPYIYEVLDSYKVGTWCAVSAHKITGPLSFEAVNSDYNVHFNLTHFVLDFAKGEVGQCLGPCSKFLTGCTRRDVRPVVNN
jgi:hypothetical protein